MTKQQYFTDLTDAQWQILEPFFSQAIQARTQGGLRATIGGQRHFVCRSHRLSVANASTRFSSLKNRLSDILSLAKERSLGTDSRCLAKQSTSPGGQTADASGRHHRQPKCQNDQYRWGTAGLRCRTERVRPQASLDRRHVGSGVGGGCSWSRSTGPQRCLSGVIRPVGEDETHQDYLCRYRLWPKGIAEIRRIDTGVCDRTRQTSARKPILRSVAETMDCRTDIRLARLLPTPQ